MKSNLAHKVACRGVPAPQIMMAWPSVSDLLQRGIDRGSNHSVAELFKNCLDGTYQLWVAEQNAAIIAALVTSIDTIGDRKQCTLRVAGGAALDDWADHLPYLGEWAKQHGCEEFRIYGRIGWARKLGFDVVHTELRKSL